MKPAALNAADTANRNQSSPLLRPNHGADPEQQSHPPERNSIPGHCRAWDRPIPHTSFLVTGASGFIGVNLVQHLCAQGHKVRCLTRPSSESAPLQQLHCQIVSGDLQDDDSLARAVADVQCVVHLAGLTSAFTKQQLFEVNGQGTERVARICAHQSSPPVLIYISSIAASGPVPRGELRLESDPPRPISDYGESKLAGEESVQKWAEKLPITILRPGMVFGPRDVATLPIFRSIRNIKVHAVPGMHSPPLSLIHVQDLSRLIELAAVDGERLPALCEASPQTTGKGIYFAAGPEHPDYAQLGRILRKLLCRPRAPVLPLPIVIPYCLASVSECVARLRGRPGLFNRDKIREARVSSWACSSAKAQEQLGFAPEYSLEERLQQTIEWYRQENWL